MPRPKTKTKSENLARIRQNQRRSRAQRREYVQSLETKVKEYEDALATKEEHYQNALQKLKVDVESMQQTLNLLSTNRHFPRNNNNGYEIGTEASMLKSVTNFPQYTSDNLANDLSIPLLLPPSLTLPSPSSFTDEDVHNSIQLLSGNTHDMNMSEAEPELQLNGYGGLSGQGTLDNSFSSADLSSSLGLGTPTWSCSTPESTTLCSQAYQLIVRCNKKEVDLRIIHLRMQHGFRQGNIIAEGCRVDNQVLLDILTEISQ